MVDVMNIWGKNIIREISGDLDYSVSQRRDEMVSFSKCGNGLHQCCIVSAFILWSSLMGKTVIFMGLPSHRAQIRKWQV